MHDCPRSPGADEFEESVDDLDGRGEAEVPTLGHAPSFSTTGDVPVLSSPPTAYSDHFYAL